MENKNSHLLYSKETSLIIKSFYKVYNQFGFGFENNVYKNIILTGPATFVFQGTIDIES